MTLLEQDTSKTQWKFWCNSLHKEHSLDKTVHLYGNVIIVHKTHAVM